MGGAMVPQLQGARGGAWVRCWVSSWFRSHARGGGVCRRRAGLNAARPARARRARGVVPLGGSVSGEFGPRGGLDPRWVWGVDPRCELRAAERRGWPPGLRLSRPGPPREPPEGCPRSVPVGANGGADEALGSRIVLQTPEGMGACCRPTKEGGESGRAQIPADVAGRARGLSALLVRSLSCTMSEERVEDFESRDSECKRSVRCARAQRSARVQRASARARQQSEAAELGAATAAAAARGSRHAHGPSPSRPRRHAACGKSVRGSGGVGSSGGQDGSSLGM